MEKMKEILKKAIFEVMEKMYFLFADDKYEPLNSHKSMISAYIGIMGSPEYLITISAEKELIENMAIDFLGLESADIDEDTLWKCMFETVNVIGGKVLLSFEEPERNITLPKAKKEEIFGEFKDGDIASVDMTFNGLAFNSMIERLSN